MPLRKRKTMTTKHAEPANSEEVVRDFHDVVNMTASQIEKWLATPESKEVGQKSSDGGESTGHHSGRHIIAILHKKKSVYADEDYEQMHRTVSYVRRHLAQRPHGDITDTHWRYSLMNWGHDPEKK